MEKPPGLDVRGTSREEEGGSEVHSKPTLTGVGEPVFITESLPVHRDKFGYSRSWGSEYNLENSLYETEETWNVIYLYSDNYVVIFTVTLPTGLDDPSPLPPVGPSSVEHLVLLLSLELFPVSLGPDTTVVNSTT